MLRPLRNSLLVVAAVAGMACLILAWSRPGRQRIPFDADAAFAAIQELSGPGYEGRLTGSQGNRKAMAWVADRFRELGLRPFANTGSYEQPFEAYVPMLRSAPVLEVRGPGGRRKTYRQYVDFRETFAGHAQPGDVQGRAEVLAAARSLKRPERPILLFDHGDSLSLEEGPLLGCGVKGVLLKEQDAVVGRKGGSIASHAFDDAEGFVKFLVRAAVMEELKRATAAGCTIHMKADFTMRWVRTANVAGYLPAADGRTDEVEMVSCHLDHIGRTPEGAFFPGALDNASGTGIMLALARAVAARHDRLSKAFVFVAFNAEEEYLGGSSWLLRQPPLMPDKAEVLNFDMVGSREKVILELDSVALSAREDPSDPIVAGLEDRIKRIADRHGIPVRFNRRSESSDHVPFAMRLIPAVTFCHDAEGDYHTLHDDLRGIDKGRLGEVGQVALEYLASVGFAAPLAWLVHLLAGVALAAALGAAAIGMALWGTGRERPIPWAPLATGLAVLALMLCGSAGVFRCAPSSGMQEAVRLVQTMDDDEAALAGCGSRPFPSSGNEAAADLVAARFQALGLQPYGRGSHLLESRAMLPSQVSAPVLQLLAPDGTVLRSYVRGRDFLETTAGHGGGGSVEGPFRVVTTAFDAPRPGCAIACIRKTDAHLLDEYAFAKAGAKALLVEGDPALPPPRDDSDDKNTQLQNEGTFLRFIVSRAVMDGLAEAADHGARLRAAWDMRFQWAYPKTVIGCIPGSETEADNELIIATALDTPAAKPGARPGRALPFFMALAEAMARQHLKPRHPIVFMASNGAWAGQLGTRAYLDSPMTFKPSRKGSWMGDEEDTHGLVGDYLLARNKAAGHFATGRHVLFLADGDDPIPTLCTGAGTPFFVLPGERMGRDLTRSAGELGLPWRTSTASTGFEHERFSERWNPAATLMLPAMDRDGFSDVARVLATFIRHDAVSLAPTPLEWVRHTAAALLVAAGAALVASRLSRTAKARQPRTPDPYDAFLKRHEEDGEAP